MFIDRPSFLPGGVPSRGNVSSAYNSGALAPAGAGSGKSALSSDILSTNTLVSLAGALDAMSEAGNSGSKQCGNSTHLVNTLWTPGRLPGGLPGAFSAEESNPCLPTTGTI